ncbi:MULTISPECIES: hypothetical protein [Streptomyces]|uniref:Sortase n=1 Tax=Streptomyces chengmaiensis TaxID=3040919 RepID=A0ABT6HN13_9ACTN|nr:MULTISPECIES: hypothetical protein [Streptomyces]MDH2389710.1 hypothetical protein [Streptomyces chengmaiensis]WRQ82931.1 hypothetical protein I3F59_028275 [Streptomyces sp. MUM 178J]
MRTARVRAVGALTMLALGFPAASAAADESEVHVSPGVAYPGSTVAVSTSACESDVAYAKGQAEAGGQINLLEGGTKGELSGEFTVPQDTEEGVYSITVKCPPSTRVVTEFEVARQPDGAVRGGFGGAGAMSGTEIAAGSALIVGAAAGGIVLRRRRSDAAG